MATVGFNEKDAARIVRAVKLLERQMKSVVASDRRANPHRVGSGGGVVRAKVQSPEPTGTVDTASVKLLDSAGVVTGSAFDVFLVAVKGNIAVANYAPTIEEADIVFIQKIYTEWYLVPGLLELDDCA